MLSPLPLIPVLNAFSTKQPERAFLNINQIASLCCLKLSRKILLALRMQENIASPTMRKWQIIYTIITFLKHIKERRSQGTVKIQILFQARKEEVAAI